MFNRKLRKELEDTQKRLDLLERNLFAERKSHDNTFVLLLQEQELRKTVEEANERMREIPGMRVGEVQKTWANPENYG